MTTEEEVLNQVREVMTSLNILHFPTIANFRAINKQLEKEVYKLGGSVAFAEKYNIPMKRKVVKWNEDKIEETLRQMINESKLEYFPTGVEMEWYMGDMSLRGVVHKYGGYRYWAEKLNLPIREGDTFFGHYGEDILKTILQDKGYKVERLSTNCLYDFLINDLVRVDCKISKLYQGQNGNFYSYNLERPNPDCDIFILIAQGESNRIMVVPQQVVQGQKQISIGETRSKWYTYEDRYDYIDKYVKFYNELI